MIQQSGLKGWRKLAEDCLSTIDTMKDSLVVNKQRIDTDHPDWKTNFYPEWWRNDARAMYFQSLAVVLNNAMFSYIFLRDDMSGEEFWSKGKFGTSAIDKFLQEYAIMVKWFTFHSAASCTEETFRAIVRSAPDRFDINPSAQYWKLYKEILNKTSLPGHEELFATVSDIRNTIHNNGYFRPTNNQPQNRPYGGRTFEFEVNKGLTWLTEEVVLWFLARLNEAMFQIVTAKHVAEISYCPRAEENLGISTSMDNVPPEE